jgi:hypothetical protein
MKGLLEQFELDGRVSSHEPVRGKPYQAGVEEIHTRYNPLQSARAYGTQWRDSQGRVRTDAVRPDPMNPGRTLDLTTIFDAVTSTTHLVSKPTGLRHTFQVPRYADELQALFAAQVQPAPPAACPAPVVPAHRPRHEALGERIIEGVKCVGYRSTDDARAFLCEHWFSKELSIGFVYFTRDSEGETAFRLYNLRLTEPDPSLFLIPREA